MGQPHLGLLFSPDWPLGCLFVYFPTKSNENLRTGRLKNAPAAKYNSSPKMEEWKQAECSYMCCTALHQVLQAFAPFVLSVFQFKLCSSSHFSWVQIVQLVIHCSTFSVEVVHRAVFSAEFVAWGEKLWEVHFDEKLWNCWGVVQPAQSPSLPLSQLSHPRSHLTFYIFDHNWFLNGLLINESMNHRLSDPGVI